MIELPLTDEGRAYGKRVKRDYDRAGVSDKFKREGTDRRWIGHAVEFEVDRWLTRQGIEHVWNGGLDNLPDFVLGGEGGIKVALKTNNCGQEISDDFQFVVPEDHVYKLGDGALFVIAQTHRLKLYIAGYLSASKFRTLAEKRRKGGEGFMQGRPNTYDCRSVALSSLTPAETFFDLLRVAA